jgi:hypothetical protein
MIAGIYGHSFIRASKRVFELFRSRGVTAIINDNLIARVLFLGCLVVGLVTCAIGVLLAIVAGDWLTASGSSTIALCAALGFIVGLLICNVRPRGGRGVAGVGRRRR